MYHIIQEDKPIILKDKYNVLKIYLTMKMLEMGHVPFDNDIDILCELYFHGGYSDVKDKKRFYKTIIDKEFRNSEQSVSNKLTEFFGKQYIYRRDKNVVELNYEFFPKLDGEVNGLGLLIKVAHAS